MSHGLSKKITSRALQNPTKPCRLKLTYIPSVLFKKVYLKDGDDLIPAAERYHRYKETDQEIIREAFRQILAAAFQEVATR